MAAFRTTRRVEFVDTDMAGIAHFSNFFRWMEEVEQEFLRSLGLSVTMKRPGQGRLGFPRVAAQCDFIRPVRFEDEIECLLSVERLGEKAVTWGHEFRVNGQVAAKGKITACCCEHTAEGLRGVPIPDDVRAKLTE